jgi:hypothetical protein
MNTISNLLRSKFEVTEPIRKVAIDSATESANIREIPPPFMGWYDMQPNHHISTQTTDDPLLPNTLVLCYWNEVVNRYPTVFNKDLPPDRQHDNPERYTAEHYVSAIRRMIKEHDVASNGRARYMIDIPICQVYPDISEYPSGYRPHPDGGVEYVPLYMDSEFISYVVTQLEDEPKVVGWYTADEPEVWGYREVVNNTVLNDFPPVTEQRLTQRYDLISFLSDKPQMVVFCDFTLVQRANYTVSRFCDIVGFDIYPFMRLSDKSMEPMRTFFKRHLNSHLQYCVVGQGIGPDDVNGNSLRTPSSNDHLSFTRFVLSMNMSLSYQFEFTKKPAMWGYLLWSARYATQREIENGNVSMVTLWRAYIKMEPLPTATPKPVLPWWKRVLKFIGILK